MPRLFAAAHSFWHSSFVQKYLIGSPGGTTQLHQPDLLQSSIRIVS